MVKINQQERYHNIEQIDNPYNFYVLSELPQNNPGTSMKVKQ